MKTFSFKSSDLWGAAASSLCLIHCVMTPVLFVSHSLGDSFHEGEVSLIWKATELLFLLISGWAVVKAAGKNIKDILFWIFWLSWTVLAASVILEWCEIPSGGDITKYSAGSVLITAHAYRHFKSHPI